MLELNNNWYNILKSEFEKSYFKQLITFVENEYQTNNIYPKYHQIFNAFNYTSYDDVKVVIIGQDPYHEKNQAHGLAFSVTNDCPIPPSLKNIFKELNNNYHTNYQFSGDLTNWAKQGVLLLNNVLTVREHVANSHKNKGWEQFTSCVIEKLNQKEQSVIFVLWGNDAKKQKKLITNSKHYILEAAHPSPLSAYNGFFGCQHFIKINQILSKNHQKEIDWFLIGYKK